MSVNFNPQVEIKKPGQSNQNLSCTSRFSCAPGLLYPVYLERHQAGDHFRISMSTLVKTLPLLGPLMGSAKVQFDWYHIPDRLYCRDLHNDKLGFNPENVLYPRMLIDYGKVSLPAPAIDGCHPSSLFHFMNIPEKFTIGGPQGMRRSFNAIPYLGYWDIVKGYYINTQEPYAYKIGVTEVESSPLTIKRYDPNKIDDMRNRLLSVPYVENIFESVGEDDPYQMYDVHQPLGGLALRTYLPDRFNVWIDQTTYADTLDFAPIDTSEGMFTMDQFRLAQSLNKMLLRTAVSGGRYSDYIRSQYGVSLSRINEMPSFFGSISTHLNFEDVVQTSASIEDEPLGTLGGRGIGYTGGRGIHHYSPEAGYVMCIMSIIPHVDYYQGTPWFYELKTVSDNHVPALDGIGYQDLLVDEFYSADTRTDPATGFVTFSNAVGKQPAFTEYMTSSSGNRLHGDFANPNRLMYLTFARRYGSDEDLTSFTTYMNPLQFNNNFADASLTAENFWMQCVFKVHVRRAISKRLMPR